MEKYVQSVDGIVNLIGGPEVGLFAPINAGRVVVRLATGTEEIGWVDDGERFVPQAPVTPEVALDPIEVLREMILDLQLMILETGGAVR